MGNICCSSSNSAGTSFTKTETLIIARERELQLNDIPATAIIESIDSLGYSSEIPIEEFHRVLEHFTADPSVFRYDSAALSALYSKLSDKTSQKVLILSAKVLGLMLGKGQPPEKARLLYESFVSNNEFSRKQIQAMLYFIADISVKLVWLAVESLPENKLTRYCNQLTKGIPRFVYYMTAQIYSNEDTLTSFYSVMSKTSLTPSHIRKRLKQYSKESVPVTPTDFIDVTEFFPSNLAESANTENTSQNDSSVCKKMHELRWTNAITLKKATWLCEKCKKTFSKEGWHCEECDFTVCEDCNSENQPLRLMCDSQHVLELRTDTNIEIKCNVCGCREFAASWHCESCPYDICVSCARNNGYFLPETRLLCKKGHDLEVEHYIDSYYREKYNGIAICNFCQKAIFDDCWHCAECEYPVCLSCSEYFFTPPLDHVIFQCQKEHFLRLSKVDGNYCCICDNSDSKQCYYCLECKVAVCPVCVERIDEIARGKSLGVCPSSHNLAWGHGICHHCELTTGEIRGLICDSCEYVICIRCTITNS